LLKFISEDGKYNILISDIDLIINKTNNKLNIYDYINCEGALYMSKCSIIILHERVAVLLGVNQKTFKLSEYGIKEILIGFF
jgi:hypothetical protein